MKHIKTLVAALLFMTAAATATAQEAQEDLDAKYATALLQPGTVAPDFTLQTPDGGSISLSSLKGKTVVLDFWASWCPDCRKDAPEIVRLYGQYHSDAVEFVGISMDTNVEAWQKAISQYGIKYPQGSELKKFHDTDISKAYGVKWIPSLVVVGPDGRVLLSTVVSGKVERLLESLSRP